LRVSRNIAYFVIAGLTFTGYEVQKTSKQWALLKHVRQIENKKGLVHGALIAVICILILSQLFLMNAQVTGFGVDDMKVPVKVGDFLEQNEIAGNGYNEFAIGSYLIFRNLPSKRVLIHNQVEAYPPSIFDTYMQAYVNKNTMTRLVNQYKINYAIIKLRERGKNLIEWFASSKKWNMVYFDGMYFIFVVNNEQNKALIEQYSTFERAQALDEERARDTFSFMRERTLAETILANVTGTAEVGYTQFNKKNVIAYRKAWAYLGMSYFNAAEQELANALRAAPWDKDVVHTFYTLYGRTKQYDRLQMVQAEVLQKFPEDRSLQFSYALALINTGHYDESLEVLDRLEKEKYLAYAINKARGDVYLMQGAFSDAEGYYLQARAVGKRYNEINLILGKLYVLMGDLQKARKMTEDYLAVNKHDTDAMLILADIYRGLEMPEDAQAMYKKVLDHDLFNEKARAFLRKK
ncbi:MAG: tetratricopeptide repeat protein, partial [Candidatus Omnitrophica bacterium]|nr:tetratricopeptide repeat protein [Candidatus Omnitrophota bacterium]